MSEVQDVKAELDAIEAAIDQRKGDLPTHQSGLEAILAKLTDSSELQPRVHRLIGVVLNRRKSDRQALEHLAQAKAKAEAASPADFGELIKIGREMAVVYAWRGDDRSAALELLPALAFSCLRDDRLETAKIVVEFARIELEAQRFGNAARLLQQFAGPASEDAPKLPLPLPENDALRMQINLCQALNRIGEHAEAGIRAKKLAAKLPQDAERLRLLARFEEVRAEAGSGNLAEAERILHEAKELLPKREGAYEQSEYLQVETELQGAQRRTAAGGRSGEADRRIFRSEPRR